MRIRKRWFGLALGLVLAASAWAGYRWFINPAHALETSRVQQLNQSFGVTAFRHRVTLLFLGSSLETAGSQDLTAKGIRNRADTLMVVSLDPTAKQVGILSIPRDSRVEIPGVGLTKVAECSFFGGPTTCVKVVESLLHVPIDYYAFLGMFQLPKLVDDLGGLTLDIPQTEQYEAGQPLGINLPQGVHHLNGQQVLEFVRFRNSSEGDITRIQQQQAVVRALVAKLLRPSEIPRWPTIARDALQAVSSTNLSLNQLLALGLAVRQIPLSAIRYGTLPGHGSVHLDPYAHQRLDYWSLDPRLIPVLVQNVLLGQSLTPTARQALKVEVASGTASLAPAQSYADWLRQQGYDVVGVGWANHASHRRSEITNTTGDRSLGPTLAQPLGPTVETFTPYHTSGWDVRVVVGADYHPASSPSAS